MECTTSLPLKSTWVRLKSTKYSPPQEEKQPKIFFKITRLSSLVFVAAYNHLYTSIKNYYFLTKFTLNWISKSDLLKFTANSKTATHMQRLRVNERTKWNLLNTGKICKVCRTFLLHWKPPLKISTKFMTTFYKGADFKNRIFFFTWTSTVLDLPNLRNSINPSAKFVKLLWLPLLCLVKAMKVCLLCQMYIILINKPSSENIFMKYFIIKLWCVSQGKRNQSYRYMFLGFL